MKINILEFAEGARKAKGVTVIIDVFRAFSVGCYAIDAGAAAIVATRSVEEALALKKKYRNCILAGERNEKRPDGFDLGNSPTEILMTNLQGVTFVHTTTAGTKGLFSASDASLILTGSLVNAGAVAAFIRSINPGEITLVAMGYKGHVSADEDLLCARIIANRVNGGNDDFTKDIMALRESSGARFFKNENITFSPPSDFFLCTMTDRFNFVLKATKRYDGNIDLMKIEL